MSRRKGVLLEHSSAVQVFREKESEKDIVVKGSRTGDRLLLEAAAVVPKKYLCRCIDALSAFPFDEVDHLSLAFRENGIIVTCRDISIRTANNTVDAKMLMNASRHCYEVVRNFLRKVVSNDGTFQISEGE